MKGILLAGGAGSRLNPMTLAVSKQLLPIYDKPMIFYPLSVLMLAEIKDILIITAPDDLNHFKSLLGDGSEIGINLAYAVQDSPDGIAQAFIIGEEFIGEDPACLILGDNLFYSRNLKEQLLEASQLECGGHVFGYKVSNPKRFGVIEFDENRNVISIEEKPSEPKSDFAVTGLYFYDNDVIRITKDLKPSDRGELEITDINSAYLHKESLKVSIFDEKVSWLDTGTFDSLLEASIFIKRIQENEEILVGSVELVAFQNNWLNDKQINNILKKYSNTPYGQSLQKHLIKEI